MNIFLDDVRLPSDMGYMNNASIYFENKFKVVKNVDEFKKLLTGAKEEIGIISFDHDLLPNHYENLFESAEQITGNGQEALFYFFKWVSINHIDYEIQIIFHTMNYHGLQAMLYLLSRSTLKNINLIQRTPIRYLAR